LSRLRGETGPFGGLSKKRGFVTILRSSITAGLKTFQMPDLEHPAVFPGRQDQSIGGFHGVGDRLFDQHMNALLQKLFTDLRMKDGGCLRYLPHRFCRTALRGVRTLFVPRGTRNLLGPAGKGVDDSNEGCAGQRRIDPCNGVDLTLPLLPPRSNFIHLLLRFAIDQRAQE